MRLPLILKALHYIVLGMFVSSLAAQQLLHRLSHLGLRAASSPVQRSSSFLQEIFHDSQGLREFLSFMVFTLSVVFMAWGTLLRITLTRLEFPSFAASSRGEAPSASRASKRFGSWNFVSVWAHRSFLCFYLHQYWKMIRYRISPQDCEFLRFVSRKI